MEKLNNALLIFLDNTVVFKQFEANRNVISITKGNEYYQESEQKYTLNFTNQMHLKRFFEDIFNRISGKISIAFEGINHLGIENESKANSLIDNTVWSVISIIQSIYDVNVDKVSDFIYIYEDKNSAQYGNHAMHGFINSIKIELPKIRFKIVQILEVDGVSTDITEVLYNELENNNSDVEIRYKGMRREVRKIVQLNDKQPEKEEKVLFPKNGVCIITGGVGGIGMIFADHMIKKYNAHLFLVGRKKYDDNIKAKIDALNKLGNNAEYFQCDVSSEENVATLVNNIKQRFGCLDGVIHAAGCINDSMFFYKKRSDFLDVVKPKMFGILWLVKHTANENLSFFISCSSISGVLGNIGQSDYAYGNCFLDAYTSYCRDKYYTSGTKYISINWPFWKNGGMNVSKETEDFFKSTFGMSGMTNNNGINVVNYALKNNISNFIAIEGNENQLKKSLGINDSIRNNNISLFRTNSDNIESELKKMIVEIQKISEYELEVNENYSELCFDSISFAKLCNHINKKFDLHVAPSIFFEYSTIKATVEYLRSQLKDKDASIFAENSAENIVSEKETSNNISDFVKSMISEVIKIDADELEEDTPLSEFGFDSILFTKLCNYMNRKKGISISPNVFFEYTTIKQIEGYLYSAYHEIFDDNEVIYHEENIAKKEEICHLSYCDEAFDDTYTGNEVAIIGMSGKMPMSDDLDVFWKHLANGDDLVGMVPENRPVSDEMRRFKGGYLNDIDAFDPLFFHLTPMEAELMDPQQRVFLETMWHVIEDAGYKISDLSGTDTGIFVGVVTSDYNTIIDNSNEEIKLQSSTGISHAVLVNRISYLYNLKGPSEPFDTACSSSLLAVHRAVKSIQDHECSMAIAGGVNLILDPKYNIAFSAAGMLSNDSKCKTFSDEADGYVRSEGVGAVFLKPLKKAIEDKDYIYGVIRGSAVNHNGRSNALTAPSTTAQAEVIQKAWSVSGVSPDSITYIEAHGTGTKIGDPIEIDGLKKAFDNMYKEHGIVYNMSSCAIGALKSNMGHAEAAAGIAGLIKVVLAMKNELIPQNLHCKRQNSYIDLNNSNFYLCNKPIIWKGVYDERNKRYVHRAGVSSFGYGGVNVHIALEDFKMNINKDANYMPELIILSAQSKEELKQYALLLLNECILRKEKNQCYIKDIAFTLQVGRMTMQEKAAWIVSDIDSLIDSLNKYVRTENDDKRLFLKEQLNIDGEFPNVLSDISSFRCDQLKKAGVFWLSGKEADFFLWYENENVHRTHLPGYPFKKERYWVSSKKKNYVSDLVELNEEYFSNHIINLEMIYPAAASIALLVDFAAPKNHFIELKDIEFKNKISADKTDSIKITDGKNGHYKILKKYGNEYSEVVAAVLNFDERIDESEYFNFDSVNDRLRDSISSEEIYEKFSEVNMEYGNLLQCLKSIKMSENEVLSCIENNTDTYCRSGLFVPAVIDCVFQSVIGSKINDDSGDTFIPFYIKRFVIYEAIPENCYAYVNENEDVGSDLSFDILIIKENGKIAGRVEGLFVHRLSKNTIVLNKSASKFNACEVIQKVPVYIPAQIGDEKNTFHGTNIIYIMHEEFLKKFPREQHSIIVEDVSRDSFFDVDKFKSVLVNGTKNIIVPLLTNEFNEDNIDITLPFDKLFEYSKLCAQEGGDFKIVCIYNSNNLKQLICSKSFMGFFESIVQEGVIKEYLILGISDSEDLELAYNKCLSVIERNTKVIFNVYEYKNSQLYRLSLERAKTYESSESILRENGTYLLTGGNGGIGRRVGKYLSDKYNANLVILCRSECDDSSEKKLCIKTDISKKQDVERAISIAIEKYGKIDGVFHMAGILDDGLFINKSKQDIINIVKPKLTGMQNVDKALEGIELDFVMMFSSTTSFWGNTGQTGYAYANSCLDAYAYYREYLRKKGKIHGATKVIDWSYWLNGGMQISSSYLEKIETDFGILPITDKQATETIEISLSDQEIQRVVYSEKTQNLSDSNDNLLLCMVEFIKKIIFEITKIPVNEINAKLDLEEYGLDSIMTLNIIKELEKTFGSLPKTLTFEYQSIEALAGYFVNEKEADVRKMFSIHSENSDKKSSVKENIIVDKNKRDDRDIAIIGISGVYPGANDLQEFWENLKSGTDCITEVPNSRWNIEKYYSSDRKKAGKTNCRYGGFIDGADEFDPLFFHISPKEAKAMDPQERKFMENVWHTIESAGYTRKRLKKYNTGVFVGVMYGQYQMFALDKNVQKSGIIPESTYASVANRVSYFYDFKGPSIAIDSMCSSSLTAIHLACASINEGECEVAIAGGVNLSLHPHKYLSLSQSGFLSDDGRCRSFGEGGSGYVPGEGVGSVMLKPLSKAIEDGDYIYAVIKGSALNHGGKTNGYSVPNPSAQADVIYNALKKTDCEPDDISYIEAHGTGTSLGDPIEIQGLNKVLKRKKSGKIRIGSVKSNIGHLESAAGIAAISKVVLQFKHAAFVPSLHSKILNSNLGLDNTSFKIQQIYEPWNVNKDEKRTAGVSAFGAGGSNTHIIIQEYIMPEEEKVINKNELIVLSVEQKDRLFDLIERYYHFLECYDENGNIIEGNDLILKKITVNDVAYTLQNGREQLRYRMAFVVESLADFKKKMSNLINNIDQDWLHISKDAITLTNETNNLSSYLLENGEYDLDKIASDWINGKNMPWEQLYKKKRRIVPLIEYPFSHQVYRVPLSEDEQLDNVEKFSCPSTLLGNINVQKSLRNGLVFETVFKSDDEKICSHVVNGKKIIPAAFWLEIMALAAKQLNTYTEYSLSNINLLNTCIIENNEHKIETNISTDMNVEIVSDKVLCKGKINNGRKLLNAKIDINDIKQKFVNYISDDDIYELFESSGLNYGKYNRVIDKIYYNNMNEALAHIKMNDDISKEINDYVIHPSVIDGALQGILGVMYEKNNSENILLPYHIDSLEIFGNMDCDMYAYIIDSGEQVYNIALIDVEGNICVRLLGVEVRTINKKNQKVIQSDSLYYKMFRPLYSNEWSTMNQPTGNVLVLCSHGQETLKNEFTKIFSSVKFLSVEDEGALRKYIEEASSIDRIYYISDIAYQIESAAALSYKIESSLLKLMHIVKILSVDYYRKPLEFIAVTHSVYNRSNESSNYADAGIHGFIKSLAKEFRHWKVTYVSFENDTAENNIGVLLNVPYCANGNGTIWNGEKYIIESYNKFEKSLLNSKNDYMNTTWIIAGGAGGIGLVLSEHLEKSGAKKVILIGRRSKADLDEYSKNIISNSNNVIEYYSADIADENSMIELAEKIKNKYSRVDYVVHSAIVLDDKSILNMSDEDLIKVVTPKAEGSYSLCEAMKILAPQKFIFFSSVQSIAGNAGQSNYAAGCCIKEAYASHLRSEGYDAVVIRWGYWGNVGRVSSDKYRKAMESNSIGSISVDEGMAVIDYVIKENIEDIIFIKASESVMAALGMGKEEPSVRHASANERLLNMIPEMILSMFRKKNMYIGTAEAYNSEELVKKMEISESHVRVFHEILEIMVKYGYFEKDNDLYVLSKQFSVVSDDEIEIKIREYINDFPEMKPYAKLLWECSRNLLAILSDQIKATDIIFPKSQMNLVDETYKGNEMVDIFNYSVAQTAYEYTKDHPDTPISILEIGAGTGGTSLAVLEKLLEYRNRVTYYYTDISNGFLRYGKEKFAKKYPFIKFRLLNIEKDPMSQGFDTKFDVVIAANVLHATKSMDRTLSNVHKLMKNNGILIINEVTRKEDNLTLTYGLLDGWWLFEDEYNRISGSPLLNVDKWNLVLSSNGFGDFNVVSDRIKETKSLSQSVITARAEANETINSNEKKKDVDNNIALELNEIQIASEDKVLNYIYNKIEKCIIAALEVNNDVIERGRAFSEYGVDSITGLELVTLINDEFDIKMKTTIVFDYSNIELLGNYINGKYRDKVIELIQKETLK